MQITRHNEPLHTNGTPVKIGEMFPSFTVLDSKQNLITSSDLLQRITFISVVPNINTRICSLSTRKFNQDVDDFTNIDFYTISTNTVEEQKNWCAIEGVNKMQLLSDKDLTFGKNSGLYVADNNTDARSIWVLSEDGIVLYRELVIEQTSEPNYTAVLNFLKQI